MKHCEGLGGNGLFRLLKGGMSGKTHWDIVMRTDIMRCDGERWGMTEGAPRVQDGGGDRRGIVIILFQHNNTLQLQIHLHIPAIIHNFCGWCPPSFRCQFQHLNHLDDPVDFAGVNTRQLLLKSDFLKGAVSVWPHPYPPVRARLLPPINFHL